jgi:sporulation protein YlmC with PRC-barrel domain
MILTDILGRPVRDANGAHLGRVLDLRFVVDDAPGRPLSEARLDGLVVSPTGRHSYLGYERSNVNAPAIIKGILRWMHRGTFYVRWEAVQQISRHEVLLHSGYRKYDARLPGR